MKKLRMLFAEKLIERLSAFQVGHALDDGTTIGPVINERQLASNLAWVDQAKAAGIEVVGGERLDLKKTWDIIRPLGCS